MIYFDYTFEMQYIMRAYVSGKIVGLLKWWHLRCSECFGKDRKKYSVATF